MKSACRHFCTKTLQTETLLHWCRGSETPNCLETLTSMSKCLKDGSDLSAELSCKIFVLLLVSCYQRQGIHSYSYIYCLVNLVCRTTLTSSWHCTKTPSVQLTEQKEQKVPLLIIVEITLKTIVIKWTNEETNKCVSRLARRKSHHTSLHYGTAPNSDCSSCHGAQFRLLHCDFYIAHPGSNAAAMTPCEPKFTKVGEDLSG